MADAQIELIPPSDQEFSSKLPGQDNPLSHAGGGSMPHASTSISHRTADGALISFFLTIFGKGIGFGTAIVLSYLLKPYDMGVAACALTAATLLGLVREAGLNQVLIQRQKHFERWANPAFWMSLAGSILAGLLMVASIPFVRRHFHEQAVGPLLLILAIASPIQSLGTVPIARILIDMRFRFLSVAGILISALIAVLTITMAALGCGAKSLIVPPLVVSILTLVVFWSKAPFPLKLNPQFRRWRFLIGDTGWSFVASLFLCMVAQGDYFFLGSYQSKQSVGIYFFAFTQSMQISMLLGMVATFVQPGLSRLGQDPGRQLIAAMRAMRIVAIFASLTCALQIVLASAFVHLLFSPAYYPAIPIIQRLSVGLLIYSVCGDLPGVLLAAQGKFRLRAILSGLYAIVFLGAVAFAAPRGILAVGNAVAVAFVVMGIVRLYVTIKADGGTWRDVAGCCVVPQTMAIFAVSVVSVVCPTFSSSRSGNIFQLLTVSAASLAIYLPLVTLVMPVTMKEIVDLLAAIGRPYLAKIRLPLARK